MKPLAVKIVLEWHSGMSRRMAKVYKWGCTACDLVYEKQTHAQACCAEKKIEEDSYRSWLFNIEKDPPIGTYDKDKNFHEGVGAQ